VSALSEKVVRFCKLLREAKEKSLDAGGLYQSLETALIDYIEGLPKDAQERLREEEAAIRNVVEGNAKNSNILNLMHMLHCGGVVTEQKV
jgi:hypothetical protein